MTEKQLNGQTVYEFVIPSLTHDKQRIPEQKIEKFLYALKSKSLRKNKGYTIIPNAEGGYLSDSGEMITEKVMIFRTKGEIPLSETELEYFSDYLDQECLYVEKSGERYAYLHDNKRNNADIEYKYDYGDGSSIEFYLSRDPDGERCLQVIHYDENGLPMSGHNLYENDLEREMSLGDDALKEIYGLYWKSA